MNERMNEAIRKKHTMFIIYMYINSTYRLTYNEINTHACIKLQHNISSITIIIYETTKGMQILIPQKTLTSKVFDNYNNFIQTFL